MSMGITQETRREAYQDIQMAASNRRRLIYTTLRKRGPMTAEELADTLGFSDKNSVRPRLTELKALRLVGVIDKRKARSGKKTAVWAEVYKRQIYRKKNSENGKAKSNPSVPQAKSDKPD